MIYQVDWIANSTKKIALEKLDAMDFHVAYPDELLNDTEVNAYYRGIELEGGNFLECKLNASLFMVLKKYSLLRLPVSKYEWNENDNSAAIYPEYGYVFNNIGNYIHIDNIYFLNLRGPTVISLL